MALVINKTTEYNYTPIGERGEDKPFSIKFKPLTTKQLAVLEDSVVSLKTTGDMSLAQGSFNYKTVKASLISWSNVIDPNGAEVTPEFAANGEVKDESLDLIPPPVFTELANVIIGVSKNPNEAQAYLGTTELFDAE